MAFEFKLPDVGEGLVEAEVVKWMVQVGDEVAPDQPLIEIMTDKATVEIPSPKAGKILQTVGSEGETIYVGKTFVVIETNGADGQAPAAAASVPATVPSTPQPPPTLVAGAAAPATPPPPTGHAAPSTREVLATPATRRLARELDVDLTRVTPTGPRGRVTHEDVRLLQGGGVTTTPAATTTAPRTSAPAGGEERVPLRGLRKKIAEKMAQSVYTAPHFTYVEEVDVTDLIRVRSEAVKLAAEKQVKLTFLPYIIKALVAALKRYPMLNAAMDDAAGEIVVKNYYHIGIAASTEGGLMVPVIKNADQLSLLDIAREIERLATNAREGKSNVADLSGSTFTITNLGPLGGVMATPIINYPEVAILGIHKIRRRPVYRDDGSGDGDQLVPRDLMNVSLSFDHRVIDGAIGAEFTQYLVRYLEHPNLLFMEMV